MDDGAIMPFIATLETACPRCHGSKKQEDIHGNRTEDCGLCDYLDIVKRKYPPPGYSLEEK